VVSVGICTGRTNWFEHQLRRDATLSLKQPLGCDPKQGRRMFTAWTQDLPGCWVPGVHADCGHNELSALLMRSLGPTPGPAEPFRGPMYDSFTRIVRVARRYGGHRWGLLETAHSYKGAMRRRYVEAERSLMFDGPLTARDLKLRAFLKAEKINVDPKFPKPRMIFPRSPRYNLVLASWLKPFEHWLWGNLRKVGSLHVPPTRVVAKGLNQTERANLILRKMGHLSDCVVMEVDGKSFEAHCAAWMLRLEHGVYTSAYRGSSELSSLLSVQLRLSGSTRHLRFSRDGGRASGDFNTGMGNSLIMLAVVDSVMRSLGIPFDSLVDGDNALLFVRGQDQSKLQRFRGLAHRFSGHNMVLERPVKVFENVVFGQSSPLCVDGVWKMVRPWSKVVSQGTSTHIHLREAKGGARWLAGVARCEAHLNKGVPVVSQWCYWLSRLLPSRPLSSDAYQDYAYMGVPVESVLSAPVPVPLVGESTRASFETMTGLCPESQRCLESLIALSAKPFGVNSEDTSVRASFPDALKWAVLEDCTNHNKTLRLPFLPHGEI